MKNKIFPRFCVLLVYIFLNNQAKLESQTLIMNSLYKQVFENLITYKAYLIEPHY